MIALSYFLNSITLTFISWIVGFLLNNCIKSRRFYQRVSNLNFIKTEAINKSIGLRIFKWTIKNSFFKYFNQKLKFETRPTILQIQNIRREMTYSEISHLIAFLFLLIIALIKVLNEQFTYGVILFVFNFIFNLYPSLLQQQNKRQIDRILKQ